MAIDYTYVDNEHTPARFRLYADHLVNTDTAQLALLNAEDQTFYQYVEANVPKTGTPTITAGIVSKTVGVNCVVGVATTDPDIPLTYYYDESDTVNYGATVTNVPTAATTSLTVTDGQGTIADAGFVAGSHTKIVLQAHDAESTDKGPIVTLDLIFAPAAPVITAVDGTDSTANVTFAAVDGAASYNLYWMAVVGGETAQDIVDGGTAVIGYTSGTAIATGIGDFGFAVYSVNPAGQTLSNADTVTVTQV